MRETRSGAGAQLTLEGLPPGDETGNENDSHRVGGRRGTRSVRRRGGGYLHECISPDVWEGAKLRELEAMGLQAVWLEIAREIGFHRFMAVWRILDRTVAMRSESESMIEVQLRRLSSYRRYQRNRFIESLVRSGFHDRAIREMVKAQLGEDLSLSHISRLAGRRRVKKT